MARIATIIGLCIATTNVFAQGAAGDLLGGELINPRVGQWAWYDLQDKQSGTQMQVRQAIVGKKRVGGKQGYWLEIEVVPQAGYKTVVKALLTGPASDPSNIKRLIFKNGLDPAVELDVPSEDESQSVPEPTETSKGEETVQTPSGPIRAERIDIRLNDVTSTLWKSEDVPPHFSTACVST